MITYSDDDIGNIHDILSVLSEYAKYSNIDDYYERMVMDRIRCGIKEINRILNQGEIDGKAMAGKD